MAPSLKGTSLHCTVAHRCTLLLSWNSSLRFSYPKHLPVPSLPRRSILAGCWCMLQIKLLRTVTWNSSTDICILLDAPPNRSDLDLFSLLPFGGYSRSKNRPLETELYFLHNKQILTKKKKWFLKLQAKLFFRSSLRLSSFNETKIHIINDLLKIRIDFSR